MSNTTAAAPAPTTTASSPPPPAATASPPPPQRSPPPPTEKPKQSPPPVATKQPPTKSPASGRTPPPPLLDPNAQPFVSPPAPPADVLAAAPRRPRPLGPPPRRENGGDKGGRSQGNNNNNNNVVAIAVGVVVGVAAILFIALVLYFCFCRKRKRKDELAYYSSAPPPHKGGGYYIASPNPGMMAGYYAASPPPQTWQAGNKNDKKHGPDHGQQQYMMSPPPTGGGNRWQQSQTPQQQPPPTRQQGATSSSGEYSSSFSAGPPAPPPPHPGLSLGLHNSSTFSYEELQAATDGFAQSNLLGQGGFGYVHKGVLTSGKEVAVKSLKAGSGQGDREFQAEVEIITRVHHRHLVTLVGYSIARDQKLLVYEFVPNSTLEFHLHGKNRPTMDWATRLKIAIGSAKGLAYLHEDCHPRIIHRDIKAANILLEYNFEAKVADFGLAKLSQDNHTHVSTRVMGTFGYLAPEYASSGKLTEKSDVFSFGVVLLELITGRPPLDLQSNMDESLVDWARPRCSKALEDGNCQELADPRLEGNYNPQEMSHMVACAANAIRHSSKKRPKMSQIVRTLEGDASLEHLCDGGVKPGQSSYFGQASSDNLEYDQSSYSADMKKFRKAVLEDQSSEYD
ncbi:unnamed protein product [Linum tenue]|uniref:non-specific serine/threonine protein kinase n=1 Tax=Linum tenue TaxID=586396 RepID=A0AAV0GW98_9ROSI|nr:unnamed protein product [Linum tenue]